MVPLVLTITVLLGAQDDATAPLLRALEEDAIEVREKAVTRLIALGEPARSSVEKAIQETTNVETSQRLQGVLRQFDAERRRRAFKGGKIVGDLGAKLSVVYLRDQRKLEITVDISNLGACDREFLPLLRWNTRLPNDSYSGSSAEGEVAVKQLTGNGPTGVFSSTLG